MKHFMAAIIVEYYYTYRPHFFRQKSENGFYLTAFDWCTFEAKTCVLIYFPFSEPFMQKAFFFFHRRTKASHLFDFVPFIIIIGPEQKAKIHYSWCSTLCTHMDDHHLPLTIKSILKGLLVEPFISHMPHIIIGDESVSKRDAAHIISVRNIFYHWGIKKTTFNRIFCTYTISWIILLYFILKLN